MMSRVDVINRKTAVSETTEETRKKALDQLVFRELAFQEVVRLGLKVEEQRVDYEMEKFITSVGHEDGYKDLMKKQSITSVEVRAQVERSLLLQILAGREVMAKVSVSEEKVREHYEELKGKYIIPEKVSVVDVLFLVKGDAAASMNKAKDLLAKIYVGKDTNLLGLPTDGTFTVRSVDLEKSREPELYDAARKLEQGALSGVIASGDGVHILQLTLYTPEKRATFEEVKEPLKLELMAIAQVKRFQEWEQELRRDAKIEIMNVPLPPEYRKP